MSNSTSTTVKLFSAAALVASLATGANAATFTWTNAGNTVANFNGTNFDLGTDPRNGVADTVNITNGGLRGSFSNFSLENVDTYNVSNGGVIQNTNSNNKTLRGDGNFGVGGGPAILNIGDGGTGGAARFRGGTINLSGTGTWLAGNGAFNNTTNFFQSATVNFDSTWTGEIYFARSDNPNSSEILFDEASDVTDWLDSANGTNKLFLDGVALTSGDLGTKFVLTVVTSGSGNEPAFATNDAGVSLTLVPEPGSLALLGMGGLFMLRRRRG